MIDGVHDRSFRSSTVRWIRVASLVLLALMLPPETEAAGGAAEHEHADPDLLWVGVEHDRLAFLPESLLRDTPLDQLPLGEAERVILRSAIEMARPVGMPPVCLDITDRLSIRNASRRAQILDRSDGRGSEPGSPKEQGFVPREWLELQGIVERVVIGWSPTFMAPSSLIVVRLGEAIDGRTSDLARGNLVSVLIPEATLELDGKILCSKAGKLVGIEDPVPSPGEAVVVSGRPDRASRGTVQHLQGVVSPARRRPPRRRQRQRSRPQPPVLAQPFTDGVVHHPGPSEHESREVGLLRWTSDSPPGSTLALDPTGLPAQPSHCLPS